MRSVSPMFGGVIIVAVVVYSFAYVQGDSGQVTHFVAGLMSGLGEGVMSIIDSVRQMVVPQ